MPTYDFKCQEGHVNEEMLTFSEADEIKSIECPEIIDTDGMYPLHCGLLAWRQIGAGLPPVINKVMYPPTKRKHMSNIRDL